MKLVNKYTTTNQIFLGTYVRPRHGDETIDYYASALEVYRTQITAHYITNLPTTLGKEICELTNSMHRLVPLALESMEILTYY